MKKILMLSLIIVSFMSCTKQTKDYVTLSGTISGLSPEDSLMKVRSRDFTKIIKIDADGNFKDTLKVPKANSYTILAGKKTRFGLFLRNGYDMHITADSKDILKNISFSGNGSETNSYLIYRINKVLAFNKSIPELMKLDSVGFYNKKNSFEKEIKDKLASFSAIDTMVLNQEEKGLDGFLKRIESRYTNEHRMMIALAKGKPSPKFKDLENYKGGTTSLDDFKGKYVYVDVWATWCRPCLGQIPDLKALEKEYHNKNIAFVSISVDKPEKHEAWVNMIKSKGMEGTQLFSGKDNSFQMAYGINSIPRFIFIGKNGEILNANAPRPSQKEDVKAMFAENGLK